MKWWHLLVFYAALIVIFSVIHLIAKNKKPVRRAFLSSLSGFLSLIALNALGTFTGVTIPISLLSSAISIAGGVPGVTLMLLLNVLL